MKKFRKRIFGVISVCLLALGIFTVVNVNRYNIFTIVKAADKKTTSKKCNPNDESYDLTMQLYEDSTKGTTIYQITSKKGTYTLQNIFKDIGVGNDGLYILNQGSKNNNETEASNWINSTYKIVKENGTFKEESSNKVSADSKLYVELNVNDDNEGENVVLRFKLTKDESCSLSGMSLYFDVVFSMTDVVKKYARSSVAGQVDNPQYNTYCKALRDGEAIAGINTDTFNYISLYDSNLVPNYQTQFPYCFQEKVTKAKKNKNVIKKIRQVLEASRNISELFLEPTHNSAFLQAFNQSKYRAGGKISANGENSEAACATQLSSGQQSNHCFQKSPTGEIPTQSLKCDYNSTSDYRKDDGSYNFENLQSYYAYGKESAVTAVYEYAKTGSKWDSDLDRTSNENTEKTDPVTVCERVCEEAVDVEYGPPVASKAGLCFEYRVKVTSRVKCKTELNEEGTPKLEDVVACSPAPYCIHKGRKGVSNGAGPNEDFENCIKNCDGGKYTPSCSAKCYNEVYTSQSSKLAVNYDASVTKLATQESADRNKFVFTGKQQDIWNFANAYYYVNNGSIGYANGFALWYYFRPKQKARIESSFGPGQGSRMGYFNFEGIKRASNGGNYICTADCSYANCGSGYYNDEDVDYVIERNQEIYDDAITRCRAQTTCQTKQTEFQMSTDYSVNGVTNKYTIKYPSSGSSSVSSVESGTKEQQSPTLSACHGSGSTEACASDSVLYDYDGCYRGPNNERDTKKYKEYGENDVVYQSEITYPGTWIKNKTQEISYTTQGNGWTKQNEKFCLQLNVDDTNEQWWLWHMNKKANSNQYYYESTDENKCSIIDEKAKNTTFDQYGSSSSLDYNIHAKVGVVDGTGARKGFGHMNWLFQVDCFYATNDDASMTTVSENKCSRTLNYRSRTVELNNLFPNDNGDALTDSTKTGRAVGFNWSPAATISADKAGTSYAVDPSKLLATIQDRGNEIFDDDDEYLDYSFHLTQDILTKLREYNKNYKFTTYNGEFYQKSGVLVYKSNLFYHLDDTNSNDLIIGPENVKATGNIGCNNDGSGAECENLG